MTVFCEKKVGRGYCTVPTVALLPSTIVRYPLSWGASVNPLGRNQVVSSGHCRKPARAFVVVSLLAIGFLAGKTHAFHRSLALSGKANATMSTIVATKLERGATAHCDR